MRLVSTTILAALVLASCVSGPDAPPELSRNETTLGRYYGDRVTIDDLAASRESAIACARALAWIDRELREPWAEDRDCRVLVQQVRARQPVALALASDAWLGAEPPADGADRKLFGEIGVYRPHRPQGAILAHCSPDCIEAHAAQLTGARDGSARGRILPGWQHLAPEIVGRRGQYLASAWQFTVGVDTRLLLRDSLLGPFVRCAVQDPGGMSAGGPLALVEGFELPQELAEPLTPGPVHPARLLAELPAAATGLPAGLSLAPGKVERDGEGLKFLGAALNGLQTGLCDVEYMPAGTVALRVTFSYLVGLCEARASFSMRRDGFAGWVIDEATYEPAAAAMVGSRGATLDLMPLLRARQGT